MEAGHQIRSTKRAARARQHGVRASAGVSGKPFFVCEGGCAMTLKCAAGSIARIIVQRVPQWAQVRQSCPWLDAVCALEGAAVV